MPVFEFSCARCGQVHELPLSIDEPETVRCPDCGGQLVLLLRAPAPHGGPAPLPLGTYGARMRDPVGGGG